MAACLNRPSRRRTPMKPFQLPRWKFSSCCGHEYGYDEAHEGSRAGATRRDFIKGAAASIAGLAAGAALPVEAVAQGRTYPPPPPATSPVDGLIDFHVHTAPDVFGRALTDDEEAALSKDRGMEAVVLKSHTALTADRAWIARRRVPGMKIFGGITLNGAAGGITRLKDAPSGIKVVGDDGKVLPAVREVLMECGAQKLVVETGHSSGEEALAIIEAARDAGCDRIVVTHAEFEVIGMTVDQMKKAASMGAKMEIATLGALSGPQAHLAFMRNSKNISFKESADHIKQVGAAHFIISTDLGQTANPSPPDGLAWLVGGLTSQGITKEQIQTMGRENPGKLLMG
ncbi:MAG: hypothetical protein DMD75_01835 [Candidatus Rokuibacteriota bacterium]|nr:MAG: hypothetical protein DMD75_01835 [Candidatus Rokubacteria bacterium]